MSDDYIDRVYDLDGAEATRSLYDRWAASYDADLERIGYATPRRIARGLKAHLADRSAPVLDFGCGTGLAGIALRLAGFSTLDGADISPQMLEQARAKDLYRKLILLDPDGPLPWAPGDYAAITACGVIGRGAAPLETIDLLMEALAPGGLLVFSFNDHSMKDPRFEAKINEWIDTGAGRLLRRKYGAHLRSQNLKAWVYVILKT